MSERGHIQESVQDTDEIAVKQDCTGCTEIQEMQNCRLGGWSQNRIGLGLNAEGVPEKYECIV